MIPVSSSSLPRLLGAPPMPSSPSGHTQTHGCRLLLLAMVASFATVVTSQNSNWTWVDCQPSATPSPAPSPSKSSSTSSRFWSNVVALLDELPSTAAPTGFASLSRGNGTDRAFVRGLCRGDSTPANCSTYLKNAALSIRRSRCNSRRRAGIWYDDGSTVSYPAPMFAFISYAATNASTTHEKTYRQAFLNGIVVPDQDAFERAYSTLMSNLTARVVNNSGNRSSPAPMFATGTILYDSSAPNLTMHGLLQCMRDQTPAECNQCLQDSVQARTNCCYGHRGGVVLGYNCYQRMEVYSFYNLALDGTPILAPAPSSIFVGQSRKKSRALAVAIPVATVLAAVVILGVCLYRRRKANRKRKTQGLLMRDNSSIKEDIGYIEPEQLNLVVLRAATNNFSEENKLGEGGFGEVFKGILKDGEEIAVKRLSGNSSQGFQELKNELVLAAKLKHRNLVQLLGVSLQEEKLIIYEYMPNRSLDTFLSDPLRRQQLNWSKRFSIICGIARGLLYLHEESRLKVIHRDLKPSNVLLDADTNPKISDFGIARAFSRDQTRDITRRPVGTLGYMSPEYAYWGHVSNKSDMFSFGVIVLEMVTGRRNNSAYSDTSDYVSVLSHVWDNWRAGSMADVVDPSLAESRYSECEMFNCIEIGLLCVQENPADRPDASAVVLMLTSPTTTSGDRRTPSRPAFVFSSGFTESDRPRTGVLSSDGGPLKSVNPSTATVSENEASIFELQPR